MAHALTPNAVRDIHEDKSPVDPVVQILQLKKIAAQQAEAGKPDRYRLSISDGMMRQNSVMLATQLNNLVENNEIQKHTIVRLKRYVCNAISNRRIVILLDVEVVGQADAVIGNPEPLVAKGEGEDGAAAAAVKQEPAAAPAPAPAPAAARGSLQSRGGAAAASANPADVRAQPIASLNPYMSNRWVIRARVTNKAPIKTWQKETRSGKLFSVDLLDESGEIRATGFNQQVDQLEPRLEVGKLYYIRGGRVKQANRRFSTLKNDYEITFDDSTSVEETQEVTAVPQQHYDFVTLKKLQDIDCSSSTTYVDVLAVVTDVGTVASITTRSTGAELSKRDIQLLDRDATQVTCTLWGAEAENFEESGGGNGKVVAIKGARLSDYNGRSLSVSRNSMVVIAPDLPAAHELRSWYDTEGQGASVTKISTRQQGSGGGTRRVCLEDIKGQNMGMRDDGKGDYFTAKATLTFIRKENVLYQACPSATCNKKVKKDDLEDRYHCERCAETFDTFEWRLMLSSCINDFTGQTWCTAFQDEAEKILGIKAKELGDLSQSNPAAFEARLQAAYFKNYLFNCRAKADVWDGEQRVRINVVGVEPVDYVKDSAYLIEQIKAYC